MKYRWSVASCGKAIRMAGILATVSAGLACAGISGSEKPDSETAATDYAPVRLDNEKLAGVGLEEYPAMSAEEVIEGGTGHRGAVFFVGEELVAGVWEADASTLAISDPLPYDEFVTVLSGTLILTDEQGTAAKYSTGESVVLPKGFSGTWQMLGDYREIYVMETEAFMRDEESD
jgi:uncharacterized cupin superfamily protein